MNPDPTDLDRQIDLLVDDALDARARTMLLARLAAEPNGWRRCALAFLEAQAWQAALQPTAKATSVPVRSRQRIPLTLVGMAAGLVVAFALGWSARGGAAPAPLAARAPEIKRPIPESVAGTAPRPESSEEGTDVDSAPIDAEPLAASTETEPDGELHWREAARRLEQSGYEVEEPQHRMIAVELRDGRRVTVPVEEMRLRYVGHPTL